MSQETTTSQPQGSSRPPKILREGVVDSVSGLKTVRVVLEELRKEPQYGKYRRRRTRLSVHDEKQESRVGDTVLVAQCRPISKRKAWRLVKIVKRPEMV